MGDRIRDTPKHPSLHALVPDHEKVGPALGCEPDHDVCGVALPDPGHAVDSPAMHLVLGSAQDFPNSGGVAGGPLNLDRVAARLAARVLEGAEEDELRIESPREIPRHFDCLGGGGRAVCRHGDCGNHVARPYTVGAMSLHAEQERRTTSDDVRWATLSGMPLTSGTETVGLTAAAVEVSLLFESLPLR